MPNTQAGAQAFFVNDWSDFMNYAEGINDTSLTMVGSTSRKSKVYYVSPRVYGVQGHVSFTPNGKYNGSGPIKTRAGNLNSNMNAALDANDPLHPDVDKRHFAENVWAFGLDFTHNFNNGAEVNLAGALQKGDARFYGTPITNNNNGAVVSPMQAINSLLTYTVGVGGKYRGFELGVQYIDNGKSLEWKGAKGRRAGNGWAFGTGYSFGASKVGAGYYMFRRKLGTTPTGYQAFFTGGANYFNQGGAGQFSNVNLGTAKANGFTTQIEHQVVDGLGAFAEYGYMNTKTSQNAFQMASAQNPNEATPSTQSHVVMVGMKVKF